jgi:UDP-N-acetylglucosamine--N-acetylmuramyl-(pentapeptide) pyrophosphoryl-undecaprenol N-acetylglucosamine transferase
VTGNPVRRDISNLHQRPVVRDQPTLLVIGGSQGASAVNAVAAQTIVALRNALQGWNIVHQTGDREADRWSTHYKQQALPAVVRPFLDDLPRWYAQAELVISRAGATSLAELACAGCPSLLIPLPGSIYDHQRHNARAFSSAGAAHLIEQDRDLDRTTAHLTAATRSLLTSASQRENMRRAMWALARPDAATEVADLILNSLDNHRTGS